MKLRYNFLLKIIDVVLQYFLDFSGNFSVVNSIDVNETTFEIEKELKCAQMQQRVCLVNGLKQRIKVLVLLFFKTSPNVLQTSTKALENNVIKKLQTECLPNYVTMLFMLKQITNKQY